MGVSPWLNRSLRTACRRKGARKLQQQGRPATILTFQVQNVSPYENQNQTNRNELSFESYNDSSAGLWIKTEQEVFSWRLQKAELLFHQTIYFVSLSHSLQVTVCMSSSHWHQTHKYKRDYQNTLLKLIFFSTAQLNVQSIAVPRNCTQQKAVTCSYRHSPTYRNTVLLCGSVYRLQYIDSWKDVWGKKTVLQFPDGPSCSPVIILASSPVIILICPLSSF
jgi:hypothetical protein